MTFSERYFDATQPQEILLCKKAVQQQCNSHGRCSPVSRTNGNSCGACAILMNATLAVET